MAVSTPWDRSAATGINSVQDDDSLPQAGAVYVFTRTGDLVAAGVHQGVEHRRRADPSDLLAINLATRSR